MGEEEAPFDVSALSSNTGNTGKDLFACSISLDDWIKDQSYSNYTSATEKVTLMLVVQLRDPMRPCEAVGGPVMVYLFMQHVQTKDDDEEDKRFKVRSMHAGGFNVRSGTKKGAWDTGKQALAKGQDLLWSISSRIIADIWLGSKA